MQRLTQEIHLQQRLVLSPIMKRALAFLQLPLPELSSIIEEELTHNPLLEYEEEEFTDFRPLEEREKEDLKSFAENTLACEESLYDRLMRQAKETFDATQERLYAEAIIGHIEPQGLLSTPLEEISLLFDMPLTALRSILKEIQTFDPPGVGAQTVQEALLLQLQRQKKEGTLAYALIKDHFEDLLHNRLPKITKQLRVPSETIRKAIRQEISHLELYPGANAPQGHYNEPVHTITPDVTIHADSAKVAIEVNDNGLPSLRLNSAYLKMLEDPNIPKETKEYLKEKLTSGKWLMRNLFERNNTLYRIAEKLVEKQRNYLLSPKGQLEPLTMKEIAHELDLHESTIARAAANKYVSCPRGIIPMRSFFIHAIVTDEGESLSATTVKELLQTLIAKEDKSAPLSDEALSAQIKAAGIPCARRTVAKYRAQLGIGNTQERKIH